MAFRLSGRDKFALTLLMIMTTLLYADQLIMSAIIPELSGEFAVPSTTLGFIGSAFIIVGIVVSLLFGYISDKRSRKSLLIALILVGEIPCILTGVPFLTRSFWVFAVLRIFSGIGLGGIYPIAHSLLADYFGENRRATASAWMTIAWSLGAVLGTSVAGYMTGTCGWRCSFLIIGIPNIPIVLLYAFFCSEPKRGRSEEALASLIEQGIIYKKTIRFREIGIIFANKTNLFMFLQGLPGTIPWGIMTYWMITFFQSFRHLSKSMATTIFIVLGIGTVVGSLVFAFAGEWLYKKNPRYVPIMCAAGIISGTIPAYILLNTPIDPSDGRSFFLFLALAFFAGAFVSVATANVKAILMNVNRPEHRGTVFSFFNISDNFGWGVGPAIGGLIMPLGYLFTMNFSILWWIPCGIFFICVSFYITRDRDALRSLMGKRADEMTSSSRP